MYSLFISLVHVYLLEDHVPQPNTPNIGIKMHAEPTMNPIIKSCPGVHIELEYIFLDIFRIVPNSA